MTDTLAGEPLRKGNDPFTYEIMRRYFFATVEEMVRTTVRTAYSTCFSEAEDFTCALFNERAKMIAQAMGLPAHAGALTDTLLDVIDRLGHLLPGDVVITNDPYKGNHQADVCIIRAIYYEDAFLGYSANRGHWVDIGGAASGGWNGTATHVIQEALIIPPSKLYREGVLNPEIKEFILRNVRVPHYAWGDCQSQVASAITAERRIQALAARYGVDAVRHTQERALSYTRERFRRMMKVIPDGSYSAEEYLENDGHSTEVRTIRVKITKDGERLKVDFSGTDKQARGPINAAFPVVKAAVYTVLMNVIDPDIPINDGVLEQIEIFAPKGSLMNATYPAPVFFGPADPINHAAEAMFKALAPVLPQRITAGSYATGNCTTGGGIRSDGSEFTWYSFGGGGCGARAFTDGLSVDWHLMSSCKNESAEVWEKRYPLRMLDFRMRTDSGGPGEWRGGLGHVKAFELLQDHELTACVDRNVIPPFGLEGGMPGACNRITLEVPEAEEKTMTEIYGIPSPSKFANLPAPSGAIYRIYSGGGGGFGCPWKRPIELVLEDVQAGYVSAHAAREHYGVVIDNVTGEVDLAETAKVRAELAK